MIVPVILSGGAGSRLWPLSREAYPKQFLPLIGDHTMIQTTVLRTHGIDDMAPPVLVCNEEHRFLVAEQMRSLGIEPATILLEPCPRSTAPAVALAALQASEQDDDPILLVLPADHLIADESRFREGVEYVKTHAKKDNLITFGIKPERAETGYGYIKAGSACGQRVFEVDRFVEKPDELTAQRYVEAGDYFWNSGMFVFRASIYLRELERFQPAIVAACRDAFAHRNTDADFVRVDSSRFGECPSDSVDYAVMEKTKNALIMPLEIGWSDIGSWAALWQACAHDAQGNVVKGDVININCKNSYIDARERMVAAVGIENTIVVATADALLVASRKDTQQVKSVVEKLLADKRYESRHHRKVQRPWGSYDSVDSDQRFQVKRIVVNPGASLSLQMHHHRAEHWIVVSGTARVTRNDEVLLLSENQSAYIPLGARHRLENPGKIPLQLIEIQCGAYLGEDDIVRFEDIYGREKEAPERA